MQASTSSTSTPLKASTQTQSTPVGAIVGVAIAGALVLALVSLLLFLWFKRRSARAARIAGARDEGGALRFVVRDNAGYVLTRPTPGMMRQEPPITPFPADLQPNRLGMVQNYNQLGGDRGISQPTLVANPQYPFGPPIVVPPSPQRPVRQRGDTLNGVGYF